MATQWKTISPGEARAHPLYGVKGWLLLFVIGSVFGALVGIGQINSSANKEGMTLSQLLSTDAPVVSWIKFVLFVNAATLVGVLGLAFTKHPKFRLIVSMIMISAYPLVALVGLSMNLPPSMGGELGKGFLQWLMSGAVWVTYLQKSVRVRVTFENAVPLDVQNGQVQSSTPSPSLVTRKAINLMPASTTPQNQSTLITLAIPSLHIQTVPVHTVDSTSEEDHWAAAMAELENGNRRPGLWAKAFADSDGDETKTKVAYLKSRVKQLFEAAQGLAAEREKEHTEVEAKKNAAALESQKNQDYLQREFLAECMLTVGQLRELVHDADDSTRKSLWNFITGNTLLHACAEYNLLEEVHLLLASGAKPSQSNNKGQRPEFMTTDWATRLLLTGTTIPLQSLQHALELGITFQNDRFCYGDEQYQQFEHALANASKTSGGAS